MRNILPPLLREETPRQRFLTGKRRQRPRRELRIDHWRTIRSRRAVVALLVLWLSFEFLLT